MSKQHTKTTLSDRLRRGLAGILSLVLLIGLLPASALSAQAAAAPGASSAEHWATPYVNTLTEWGVMRGDINGNMEPERSITRAEFVTMMNRAYGYSRLAGHPFTDVQSTDWYSEDIDIAYNMGYFKGTSPTTASPNDPLTREQAAVLVARNMMLQPTVGETLGFTDTRELAEWSRGLVGAATESGILNGYSDGSFKPQTNITRGEVAAMLVRAIGTPVQNEGDYTLGNVYGNVTVNTSGVQLRDGVITGNLYLTGGIDLGDVLLENVNVLGEIIVSGAGESDSAQSSIVMRNVTANSMTVDSIAQQFVTIRAEGNTDIKETTVRTNAYVDDSTLPGYGLWKVIQDGGSLLQLAGNPKEVINKTPNSQLQIAQGVADKVTVDEKATNSSVLIDEGARVNELDLDVATNVSGVGDIKDLNVGAAGSTVEQLPNTVTIRPGITSNINGSEMNSAQASQASAEPMLLAGYPKAKDIAPTSATLVFSGNKPGTIYWAVSAVADGSVSEDDLIENPSYGGKIIKSGSIKADKAATEYTAKVTGLTQDGSYYISAILVDAQGKHSPVKVTAFATPDGTAPAFTVGPTATLRTTKTAQVTGTPNKSCQLYWALLPQGAAAPTPAQFKANAITGNVGYGSIEVTKNVSQSINVNRGMLKEKTNYVAYLWLTDFDGAKSSQVYRVPIYIPDETPPEVFDVRQTNASANAVEVSFSMNETGKLYWAIVTDAMHDAKAFLYYDGYGRDGNGQPPTDRGTVLYYKDEDEETSNKIKVINGAGQGAIVSGSTNVTAADTVTRVLMSAARGLDPKVYNTSTFYIYYVGEDSEKPGNLSKNIGVLEVNVKDTEPPVFIEYRFTSFNESDQTHPLADTDVKLVFNEPLQHGVNSDRGMRFLSLYQEVQRLESAQATSAELEVARMKLAKELYESIKLYAGTNSEVDSEFYHDGTRSEEGQFTIHEATNTLNYRYATVERENGEFIITFPHSAGTQGQLRGANLKSGLTYHFEFSRLYDCATTPNAMVPNTTRGVYQAPDFRIAFDQVNLKSNGLLPGIIYNAKLSETATDYYFQAEDRTGAQYGELTFPAPENLSQEWKNNPPQRMDGWFTVTPVDLESIQSDPDSRYDILFWSDRDVKISVYSRPTPEGTESEQDQATWFYEGETTISGTAVQTEAVGGNGYVYSSLMRDIRRQTRYDSLADIDSSREYAIHIDMLHFQGADNYNSGTWYDTVHFRISVVAGTNAALEVLYKGNGSHGKGQESYEQALANNDLASLGVPEYAQSQQTFAPNIAPKIVDTHIENSDTNPKITVTLDNPGFCNYVLFELSTLQYEANDTGVLTTIPSSMRITEQMITDTNNSHYIQKYTVTGGNVYESEDNRVNPLLKDIPNLENPSKLDFTVGIPTPSSVVGSQFPNTVQRGVTSSRSGNIPLDVPISTLKANTVYLLCLVPQGESGTPESRSKDTYCFRFTTEAAEAPVLNLSELGSINVDAIVDRTAQVQARLLRQDNLMSGDNIFRETLGQQGADGNSNIDSTVDGYKQYEGYTVMEALSTMSSGLGSPSVFDIYASQTLKDRIANIIFGGTTAKDKLPTQTFYDNWGPQTIRVPDNAVNNSATTDFKENQADENTLYFCVGIAYINPNGPYSFAALGDLQLVDEVPPRVNGVSKGVTYTPPDPDNPQDTGSISGTVTISFDKDLYLSNPGGGRPLPMVAINGTAGTGTVTGGDGTEFVPIGLRMAAPGAGITLVQAQQPYVRTRSITFRLDKAPGSTFTISLPALLNQWGNGNSDIQVEFTWTNNAWRVSVTGGKQPWGPLVPGYRP